MVAGFGRGVALKGLFFSTANGLVSFRFSALGFGCSAGFEASAGATGVPLAGSSGGADVADLRALLVAAGGNTTSATVGGACTTTGGACTTSGGACTTTGGACTTTGGAGATTGGAGATSMT